MKNNNNRNEWQQELNELAPFLAKQPKKNSFVVPENFFEEQLDELSTIPFEKKNPFQIPDNYFDELQNAISKKVLEEEAKPKAKVRQLYVRIGAAAAVAAMLIFAVILFDRNNSVESDQPLSEVEMDQYLLANVDLLEDEFLLDFFSEDELNELYEEPKVDIDAINDEDLEDYIKYNVDINLIEGELL